MWFKRKFRGSLTSDPNHQSVSSFKNLEYIAAGLSGIVYSFKDDDRIVLKQYYEVDDGKTERQAYHRLGSHRHVARYLGCLEDGCIFLERGQPLRKMCEQSDAKEISLSRKLRWMTHAARALLHIHSKGIVHADVGTHNMILLRNCLGRDVLKIIDFAGASIDGEQAYACYEWFSYRVSEPDVSIQTDIFALGCAMYQIVTGKCPHHELAKNENKMREVQELYRNGQFPAVEHLPLGDIMQSCWDVKFKSMDDLLRALKVAKRRHVKTNVVTKMTESITSCC